MAIAGSILIKEYFELEPHCVASASAFTLNLAKIGMFSVDC